MHMENRLEPLPAIDICEVAYDRECWRAYLRAFADDAPGYLGIFGRRLCAAAGADWPTYRRALAEDASRAVELLVEPGNLDVDADRHVKELRAQGVVHQVLHGGMWSVPGGVVNDRVAALACGHDELEFWAGLSLRDPQSAEKELRRAHQDLDAGGLSIIPFLDAVDILQPEFEPLFAYAETEQLPAWIHCGQNFAASRPVDSCGWRHIDRLAARHPHLTIIAGHGGWPWLSEMTAVAQRHRNVYIDSSTHRASAMTTPGYGWEPVLARANGPLRRKLLFGSTTWVSGRTAGELAAEFTALGLSESTLRAWLAGNAARVLGVAFDDGNPTEPTTARSQEPNDGQ